MQYRPVCVVALSCLALSLFAGCEAGGAGDGLPINDELGKPLMEASPSIGKEDSGRGIRGPSAIFGGGPTEVWATPNRWDDHDTEAAREAGMAWGRDSGLDWNEKYAVWTESLRKVPATGYGDTFELTTPWGFTMPAPVLECAEAAVFLRVAFASWYGLPFYLTAWSDGSNIHFGHFGIVRDSEEAPLFPDFGRRYEDHGDMDLEEALADWPSDSVLAGRALTSRRDDENIALGSGLYSGAYFDRIFLNKRVGYFMLLTLTYTGSVHLASTDNTFNLEVEALREGDILLKRWQRQGVGHTLAVMRVDAIEDSGTMETQVASGNMPRRQPRWQTPGSSKMSFTDPKAGGLGANSAGIDYALLGGGLKRWRVADIIDGYWHNSVPATDTDLFISGYFTEAIAERPDLFREMLVEQSPDQKMETLLGIVESKRQHLREYPASCSARIAREKAFDQMYEIAPSISSDTGVPGATMTSAMVDRDHRAFEDYVFAELTYDLSRTCCWNSSTSEMYGLVMEFNEQFVHDDELALCQPPVVFKMVDGGYDIFQAYAESVGLGDAWVAWSADEGCPQEETVETDTEAEHRWTPYCDLPVPGVDE